MDLAGVVERGAGASRAVETVGCKGFMGTWDIRQFSGKEPDAWHTGLSNAWHGGGGRATIMSEHTRSTG